MVDLKMVKEALDKKEMEPKSPYLEVAEIEVVVEGKRLRYRKVQRYAGLGRHRRALIPVYEIFDEETGRWQKIRIPKEVGNDRRERDGNSEIL